MNCLNTIRRINNEAVRRALEEIARREAAERAEQARIAATTR